ncbi:MAG: WbqC family protein [Gammaproteobacteria bacterium]
MRVAIMQPYFFPYIGYWQLVSAVDYFVIFDDVNYINKGYINRNSILLDGLKHQITLELIKASQNKLINEIDVGSNYSKLLKTIQSAYRKAPLFESAYPVVEGILAQKEKNLSKFLGDGIEMLSKYIGNDTRFIYSSDIGVDSSLKSQERVISIAKELHATHYINAIGGQELYSRERFKKEGIKLNFLKSMMGEYKQFKNDFIPSLSIIDVMMFNEVKCIQGMLDMYELT